MIDFLDDFRVALHSGDFEAAERLATNQLGLLGEAPAWLNALGLLYVAQGRMAEALLHFDRAAAADAHFVEAILNGAVVLSELGFYSESAQRFDSAMAVDGMPPEKFQVAEGHSTREVLATRHLELGRMYRTLGQRDKAVEELRRGLAICDTVELRLELARVLLEERKASEALEELEEARRLAPRNSEIHVIACQCHLLFERRGEAMEALARAELLDDRSRTGAILRRACPGGAH